jgi:hypothetical protein
MKTFELILPIKLISEANMGISFNNPRASWAKKKKRSKAQDLILNAHWNVLSPNITLPCNVNFTRIAPRSFDFDNLLFSFKNLRDSLSSLIKPRLARGQADKEGITFNYFQQKSGVREYKVKIEVIWDG